MVEKPVEVLSPFLNATHSVCRDKSPTLHKVIPILLKLTKCIETNVNDLPSIAKLKDVMRKVLDNRTHHIDPALLGFLLNHTMKDLEFLPDSKRAYKHRHMLCF